MSKKWNKEERNDLYREAFQTWGEIPQVDMLVEELAECTVATQKLFKREYSMKRMQDLAGEVADVRIMLEEICLLLDETNNKPKDYHKDFGKFSDMVAEQLLFKLERTKTRLADTKFKLQNIPKRLK